MSRGRGCMIQEGRPSKAKQDAHIPADPSSRGPKNSRNLQSVWRRDQHHLLTKRSPTRNSKTRARTTGPRRPDRRLRHAQSFHGRRHQLKHNLHHHLTQDVDSTVSLEEVKFHNLRCSSTRSSRLPLNNRARCHLRQQGQLRKKSPRV